MASVISAKAFALPEKTEEKESYRQPPHNVEAEQALLGAILINNTALNHLGDYLQPEHFYEPVHQRIFAAIRKLHDRGLIANPVTLKHYFDQDETLSAIGGGEYLARLAGAAITVINVGDYSQTIYDLALKRDLIGIGEDVVNNAFDQNVDISAGDQIEAAEQKLFNLASIGNSENSFRAIRHSFIAAINRAEFAYKNNGHVVGVSTGLTDLDKLLGGMQKSDLLILAGRPSMGKTALATNIAYNASLQFAEDARQKNEPAKTVGFFSLEMSSEQLATRILSSATAINSSKFLRGDLTTDDFSEIVSKSNDLSTLPFFIDDTPALSISAMRTRARRLKRVHNLGLIVVDYLQLLRGNASLALNNRVQEVSEITQGLKAIAKELEVPVIALSQLSRAVEQREDKRPLLSDLRESGSIEQDADVVMFVFREEYYVARKAPREGSEEYTKWQEEMSRVFGIAEVIVAKQRNGPIGNVQLHFNSNLTKFSDLAESDHLPERRFE